MPDIAITTSRRYNANIAEKLIHWAELLGAPIVLRGERGVCDLCRDEGLQGVVVVQADKVVYHEPESGIEYFFHPNLGAVRVNNLRLGGRDHLVEAMELGPGDEVLDCTLGFGAEAILCAHVVGPTGRVVGIEKVPVIAHLTAEGLSQCEYVNEAFTAVMRRVQAYNADYSDYLPQCSDDEFDIVYFDPIFDEPVVESRSMAPLRAVADKSPLTLEAVEQARRVARRRVVIKQPRRTTMWERLGITEVYGGRSRRVVYGVLGPL